jgi:hypothetical protein
LRLSRSTPSRRRSTALCIPYVATKRDTNLRRSINDLESKLGAGLIEEVIQVAEGEHKLVDEMIKSKV